MNNLQTHTCKCLGVDARNNCDPYARIHLRYPCVTLASKLSLIIGRAKRAPHWGVQSRFHVIYICIYIYVVGMSRMSN